MRTPWAVEYEQLLDAGVVPRPFKISGRAKLPKDSFPVHLPNRTCNITVTIPGFNCDGAMSESAEIPLTRAA